MISSAETRAPTVFYLYGVVPRGQAPPIVDAITLEILALGPLTAVVERVPADEFAPGPLEERLQSVEAVAPLARRHQAVLAAAMRGGPVVPARLCTLFSSAEAVRQCLAEGEAGFLDTIARVAGCAEWGLRVTCDPSTFAAAVAASDPDAGHPAPTGMSPVQAYLLSKRADAAAAQRVDERREVAVGEMLDLLEPCAIDTRERAQMSDNASGAVVLSLALLVEDGRREALQAVVVALVASYGEEGFSFEVSGPWPPYSFVDDGDGGETPATPDQDGG